MKKSVLIAIYVLAASVLHAQKTFPLQWKNKFPVKAERRYINEDRSLVLGGGTKSMAMMSGATGAILWELNFKKRFGYSKAKDWKWEKKEGVIRLVFQRNKRSPEEIYYLRDSSMQGISQEQYDEIKSKQPLHINGSVFIQEHDTRIFINYEKYRKDDEVGKHTKRLVTVKAMGKYSWSTPVDIRFMRSFSRTSIPEVASVFKGDVVNLFYSGNKVFLFYEGLTAFDIKNGSVLWQTEFENSDYSAKVFKSMQTFGRGPLPIFTNDAVFIADLTEDKYKIKKCMLDNGGVIAATTAFTKDDVVPEMFLSGQVLVARFGGYLDRQFFIPGTNGKPDTCESFRVYEGKSGLRAYNANTGALIWETFDNAALEDKISGTMTNAILKDSLLYVATEKHLFCFDVPTGMVKFKSNIAKNKSGTPVQLVQHNNNILLICKKGISSYRMNDGLMNFDAFTDAVYSYRIIQNALYAYTKESIQNLTRFVRIDLKNGSLMGKANETPYPYFTNDGEGFIRFDGSKVFKYRTGY
jgi:outer membrane protein assembly factor BamB